MVSGPLREARLRERGEERIGGVIKKELVDG